MNVNQTRSRQHDLSPRGHLSGTRHVYESTHKTIDAIDSNMLLSGAVFACDTRDHKEKNLKRHKCGTSGEVI